MSIQFMPDTPATRRAFNRLAREKLTIPKRSDGMPDYNAVTEFAKLNSITTLKDLEKLGSPISGDEYVLMTKLRCRLKKSIIP